MTTYFGLLRWRNRVVVRDYRRRVGQSTCKGLTKRSTRSRVSPHGLIVGHYEREGEIKIGDSVLDSPSDREVARRERMKREG